MGLGCIIGRVWYRARLPMAQWYAARHQTPRADVASRTATPKQIMAAITSRTKLLQLKEPTHFVASCLATRRFLKQLATR